MRKNNFIPRKKGRRVGPVLHIYCEGETEESYLNAYKRFRKYSGCETEPSHHTDPVGLVKEAIKAKEGSPFSDFFWVAYDLEDVSLENKRQAHDEAYRLAEANGINIALSAIGFEVWLLLHFTPTPKTYLNSDDAVRALRDICRTTRKEIQESSKKSRKYFHRLEKTQMHFIGVRNATILTASHTSGIPTHHFIFF